MLQLDILHSPAEPLLHPLARAVSRRYSKAGWGPLLPARVAWLVRSQAGLASLPPTCCTLPRPPSLSTRLCHLGAAKLLAFRGALFSTLCCDVQTQEAPSFLVPAGLLAHALLSPAATAALQPLSLPRATLLTCFLLHYLHRAFL